MSRARRLLLFDVDNTLVHTRGAGRAAMRTALEEVYGETGDIEGFEFSGRTDPGIVRGLLRPLGRGDAWIDERLERLWIRYLEALERELADRRPDLGPCPGVPGLLARLEEDGRFVSALVTGNLEEGAWRKLHACGLDGGLPAFGAFGSDSERREELPPLALRRARRRTGIRFDPEDAWVIGDTPEDIRAARASGTRVAAVATGHHPEEELRRLDADLVLPDLRDPDALLAALLR